MTARGFSKARRSWRSPRPWPIRSAPSTARSRPSSTATRRSNTKRAGRLGDAFLESDFPPQARLKERFGVKLTYLPVPSTADFRVNLSDEEIAAVRRNAEEALRGTVNDAVRALLDRLQEPVARLSTRLRLFRRASNGKVQHPFRDSLIENVRAIVRLAPTLNLLDDPRIGELCADIEQHLTAHDPEQLRNSARLRESVADEADAILRRMQGAFA